AGGRSPLGVRSTPRRRPDALASAQCPSTGGGHGADTPQPPVDAERGGAVLVRHAAANLRQQIIGRDLGKVGRRDGLRPLEPGETKGFVVLDAEDRKSVV